MKVICGELDGRRLDKISGLGSFRCDPLWPFVEPQVDKKTRHICHDNPTTCSRHALCFAGPLKLMLDRGSYSNVQPMAALGPNALPRMLVESSSFRGSRNTCNMKSYILHI